GGGGGGEHGRTRPLPGQRVRRAAVADGEVRGHLLVAVRGGSAPAAGAGAVLPLLQRGAAAPGPGLPDAGGGLPRALGAAAWGSAGPGGACGAKAGAMVGGVQPCSLRPSPPGPAEGSDVGERSSPGL